ncbi:hypothetical protein KJ567_03785 [Candidatus Bipolaricaulota bacterium]|nr:hypothetical protein [Candidatus Bipolaricaulota bacterium]
MMRIAAIFTLPAGSWLLALVALLGQQRALGLCALALGALWLLVVYRRLRLPLRTAMLLATGLLCGLAVFAGLPTLLATVSLSAAIYGWDLSLTADHIDAFPQDAKRRFARRYLLLSAILAGGGVALATAALAWRMTMAFSPALGLAVGSLLLAVLIVRLARGTIGPTDASED